jgi:hypothetical protein
MVLLLIFNFEVSFFCKNKKDIKTYLLKARNKEMREQTFSRQGQALCKEGGEAAGLLRR